MYPYNMEIKKVLRLRLDQGVASELHLYIQFSHGLDQALDTLHEKVQCHAQGNSGVILD